MVEIDEYHVLHQKQMCRASSGEKNLVRTICLGTLIVAGAVQGHPAGFPRRQAWAVYSFHAVDASTEHSLSTQLRGPCALGPCPTLFCELFLVFDPSTDPTSKVSTFMLSNASLHRNFGFVLRTRPEESQTVADVIVTTWSSLWSLLPRYG